LLALGLAFRVTLAVNLSPNVDERKHLDVAREASLSPGSFHLPLGSRRIHHPMGVVCLTAMDVHPGEEVRPLLERLAARHPDLHIPKKRLAVTDYQPGRLDQAESLARKPDEMGMWGFLYLVRKKAGEKEQAEESLDAYLRAHE